MKKLLPGVEFRWDNCVKCGTKLKTMKEKHSGHCKLCHLRQTLNKLQ